MHACVRQCSGSLTCASHPPVHQGWRQRRCARAWWVDSAQRHLPTKPNNIDHELEVIGPILWRTCATCRRNACARSFCAPHRRAFAPCSCAALLRPNGVQARPRPCSAHGNTTAASRRRVARGFVHVLAGTAFSSSSSSSSLASVWAPSPAKVARLAVRSIGPTAKASRSTSRHGAGTPNSPCWRTCAPGVRRGTALSRVSPGARRRRARSAGGRRGGAATCSSKTTARCWAT